MIRPSLLAACLLLTACDPSEPPRPVEPPVPTPSTPAPVEPAESPSKPTAEVPARKPAAPARRRAPEPEVPSIEDHPVLDLSLPAELVESLEPGESPAANRLLPELFNRRVESDFRLGGRLIESQDEERLFEGAELTLEIRR